MIRLDIPESGNETSLCKESGRNFSGYLPNGGSHFEEMGWVQEYLNVFATVIYCQHVNEISFTLSMRVNKLVDVESLTVYTRTNAPDLKPLSKRFSYIHCEQAE